MSAPTPLEMQLDALSEAYGLPAEAVVDLAVRNLTVLTAYQLGAEGAEAQRVFALLLAPALSAPQGAPIEAPAWPNPDEAMAGKHRDLLFAAEEMSEPFSSRELAAKVGKSSAHVGMVLAKAGWPCSTPVPGDERKWLPRISS